MMPLQSKVMETIRKYKMFSFGDKVLVAVSGGPDSVALLHLLYGLKGELGLHLEVAHVQHGIRGEEGREDALFVAKVAEELALPFYLRDVDLPGMKLQEGKGNLEAMGRDQRYRFFMTLAEERGIPKVATAHTRDDQVETVFMWLLRGSGRRGLGGIPPARTMISSQEAVLGEIMLVRPLIETSRPELIDFLTVKALQYRIDKTNLEPTSLRNWIRLHLLPQIREKIGPGLDERLVHLTDILREEEAILEQMARDALERVAQGKVLGREPLLQLEKALQRRLLFLWLGATVGDVRGFGFRNVEEALRFIVQGPPQGRLSIIRGWELVKDYKTIHLEKKKGKQKPVCYSYSLPRQGELIILEAGMKIQILTVSFSVDASPRDNREAIFDLAALPETLTVRNFRHGDRFQPLGMQGHKKLKDLFIEKKVPLLIRSTLPLLVAGGEILWIPRYGRSEIAKVGPGTKEILKVRLDVYDG